MITLRNVTAQNVNAIANLFEPDDEGLVSPNALSIAEWALRDDAWLQAIYLDDTPIGLVMVQDIPDWHVYAVWRLMVGKNYRRKSYGREVMEQVIERYQRRPGAHMLTTFVVEQEGTAEGFYAELGFERDGRRQMNQNGMALRWADPLVEGEWPTIPDDAEITLETVRSGMLRTIQRAYQSLPDEERRNSESPWIMIARSQLDPNADRVKAICANGFPIGFAICDGQADVIKASYLAAAYAGMDIEIKLR